MTDLERRLREVMAEHDVDAPTAAEFVTNRSVRVRRIPRTTVWAPVVAALVTALVVAGVVVLDHRPLVRDHSPRQQIVHGGPVVSPSAQRPLACPTSHGPGPVATGTWVPSVPRGVDGRTRLIPWRTPTSAVVCSYSWILANSRSPRWVLAGSRTLGGGLRSVTQSLAWAGPALDRACTADYLTTDADYYLIGLRFGRATEWVAAPGQHCEGSSNGSYESGTNLLAPAAAAYASGRWPDSGTYAHGGGLLGRYGQDRALVPPGVTSIDITRTGDGPTKSRTAHRGFATLVARLNALPRGTASKRCTRHVRSDPTFSLRFHYAVGADVQLIVAPSCTPQVDNLSRTANGAKEIDPLIEQLLR